jgi:broad specificity phosphatase PhoE
MTKFIFVRHGKPNYDPIINSNLGGYHNELAFLSTEGIKQAQEAGNELIAEKADIIIASPYARAFQTAHIISQKTNLNIIGEPFLHEWLPKKDFTYASAEEIYGNYHKAQADVLKEDYADNKEYETLYNVYIRTLKTLEKYTEYEKVIVACHEGVMFSLTKEKTKYCKTKVLNFTNEDIKNNLNNSKMTSY